MAIWHLYKQRLYKCYKFDKYHMELKSQDTQKTHNVQKDKN